MRLWIADVSRAATHSDRRCCVSEEPAPCTTPLKQVTEGHRLRRPMNDRLPGASGSGRLCQEGDADRVAPRWAGLADRHRLKHPVYPDVLWVARTRWKRCRHPECRHRLGPTRAEDLAQERAQTGLTTDARALRASTVARQRVLTGVKSCGSPLAGAGYTPHLSGTARCAHCGYWSGVGGAAFTMGEFRPGRLVTGLEPTLPDRGAALGGERLRAFPFSLVRAPSPCRRLGLSR